MKIGQSALKFQRFRFYASELRAFDCRKTFYERYFGFVASLSMDNMTSDFFVFLWQLKDASEMILWARGLVLRGDISLDRDAPLIRKCFCLLK